MADKALMFAHEVEKGWMQAPNWEIRQPIADEIRRLQKENQELRMDAECFRLWVHEAWHSPGDICRLLMNCETPEQYHQKLLPIVAARKAALATAMKDPS